MKRTIEMDDDYAPQAGDVVLVLDQDTGALFEIRLVRETLDETEWVGHPTTGTIVDYYLELDDVLGKVIA